MAAMTNACKRSAATETAGEYAVVSALRKLPPDYLPEVLRYIEFLDYKLNAARTEEPVMAYRITFSGEVRRQIGSLPGHIKAMARQEIAGPRTIPFK